jgi:hypothetical protein
MMLGICSCLNGVERATDPALTTVVELNRISVDHQVLCNKCGIKYE